MTNDSQSLLRQSCLTTTTCPRASGRPSGRRPALIVADRSALSVVASMWRATSVATVIAGPASRVSAVHAPLIVLHVEESARQGALTTVAVRRPRIVRTASAAGPSPTTVQRLVNAIRQAAMMELRTALRAPSIAAVPTPVAIATAAPLVPPVQVRTTASAPLATPEYASDRSRTNAVAGGSWCPPMCV
jgi:hypothetical protein